MEDFEEGIGLEDIYIARDVQNAAELKRLRDRLCLKQAPGGDFHVTQIYSKGKVEWRDAAFHPVLNEILVPGEDLLIERFGDAIVLKLEAKELDVRFSQLKAAGATWDFPDYHPHVTIGIADGPREDIPDRITLQDDLNLGPEYRETLAGEKVPGYLL